jgi:hypothetical protein
MTLADLRRVLEPLGWRFDGGAITSPSGGYWVSEEQLVSPLQVYLPVARRRELARREHRAADADEYEQLLDALEADPEVALVASRVRALSEIAAPWAAQHQATLSLWDFSLPAIRATARHPDGGMACVECELSGPATVSVTAMHWHDHIESGVPRGWKHTLARAESSAASVRARLDEAAALLFQPSMSLERDIRRMYAEIAESGGAFGDSIDSGQYNPFEVIRDTALTSFERTGVSIALLHWLDTAIENGTHETAVTGHRRALRAVLADGLLDAQPLVRAAAEAFFESEASFLAALKAVFEQVVSPNAR